MVLWSLSLQGLQPLLSPMWLLTQLPTTGQPRNFGLWKLLPPLPLLTPADLFTLPLTRAGPGAPLPAIVTQNCPWTWLISNLMWSWAPWTALPPCSIKSPHPLSHLPAY